MHHDEIETNLSIGILREVLIAGDVVVNAPVFWADDGFTTATGEEMIGHVVNVKEGEEGRVDIYCYDCNRYAPDVLKG